MSKKYFSKFRFVLSLILALTLTLSPLSAIYAENLPDKANDSVDFFELFKESFKKQISQLIKGPVNLTGKMSYDVGSGYFPQANTEALSAIRNIFLELSCQISPEEMAKQFSMHLYNKDYKEQGLKVKTYNVDEKWFIEMPDVLDKSLMMDFAKVAEKINAELEVYSQQEIYKKIQKLLESGEISEEVLSLAVEDFTNALQKASKNFQDQGEKVKDFSLEGISESLTVSTKVMSSKDLYHAYMTFLTEFKNSASMAKIYSVLLNFADNADDPTIPKTFSIALDLLIMQLYQIKEDDLPDNTGIELLEYKDANGKVRGYAFRVFVEESSVIFWDTYYLEDKSENRGNRKPFIMNLVFSPELEERSIEAELLVDYSDKDGEIMAPGSLAINFLSYGMLNRSTELNFNYLDKDKTRQLEANLTYPAGGYSDYETLDLVFKLTEDTLDVYSGSLELDHRNDADKKSNNLLSVNFNNCELIEVMPDITGLFGKIELDLKSYRGSIYNVTLESVHKGNGEFNTYVQMTPNKTIKDGYLKILFDGKLSDQLNPEIPKIIPNDYIEFYTIEELGKVFEDPKVQNNLRIIGSYLIGQPVKE